MSSEVEFKGKTVELAVAKACQELDIIVEKLKYEVLSHGATGIFGLVGARKALIRVIVPENQTEDQLVTDDNSLRLDTPETMMSLGEAARVGKTALEKITDGITVGASVVVKEEKRRIFYSIEGGRAGILIGKRGQTLEAIQYLVEKIVNRKSRQRVRVSIDVGGYLEKKRKNLEGLAEKTAQKAKQNGKPATVGQLNAHDRRIIHMALKDDADVITKSVGKGFLRKLVVLPKKHRGTRNSRTG